MLAYHKLTSQRQSWGCQSWCTFSSFSLAQGWSDPGCTPVHLCHVREGRRGSEERRRGEEEERGEGGGGKRRRRKVEEKTGRVRKEGERRGKRGRRGNEEEGGGEWTREESKREEEQGYTCAPEENTMWTHLSGTMSLRVVVQEPMKSWSPDL